ncbi:hypothetical protein KC333_g164 [Hortaea werneckii]|nr:hypothetical protein KC333_g164 [Hortaea werneckii]
MAAGNGKRQDRLRQTVLLRSSPTVQSMMNAWANQHDPVKTAGTATKGLAPADPCSAAFGVVGDGGQIEIDVAFMIDGDVVVCLEVSLFRLPIT